MYSLIEKSHSRLFFTVIGAPVTIISEGFIVSSEAGQGRHDITMGQTEEADSRLKAERAVTDRINRKVQRTSDDTHTLT